MSETEETPPSSRKSAEELQGLVRVNPVDHSGQKGSKDYSTRETTRLGNRKPLPPIEIPSKAGADTNPHHTTQHTEHSLISVPENMAALSTPKSDISFQSTSPPLDICVYLMDKSGVQMTVEDGKHVAAGELFELVMEEIDMPPEAREVFSLWMVSDLLELQLKPHHLPFKLTCQWDELLEKYTAADPDDIERDEPIVMFQRNVFFESEREEAIRHPKVLKYLYYEAKENIIDGRYVVKQEEYDILAGIQAVIRDGPFVAITHTPEYFRPNLEEYYPEHMCKTKWSLLGRSKNSPEFRLVENHQIATQRYGENLDTEVGRCILYNKYLEFCRQLPFYGAAYFNGQIEHPSRFRSHYDDPVYVAINTEGVYLIDIDKVQLLFGKLFTEMSWDYAEPKDKSNKNCLPCLWMQFEALEDGEHVTKLLQVFSKEAIMMDALVDTCVAMKQKQVKETGDTVDGRYSEKHSRLKARLKMEKSNHTKHRLCLATFNLKGDCIDDSKIKKVAKKIPKQHGPSRA